MFVTIVYIILETSIWYTTYFHVLGANLLANLSIVITYESFITFGLVAAVPVCAGGRLLFYPSELFWFWPRLSRAEKKV